MDVKIPDWRWFWGVDKQPDHAEAERLLREADVLLADPSGVTMMIYDRSNLVATLHIYLEPRFRNSRIVVETVRTAERIATADGMKKIVAPLTEGNPFLRGGKKLKFGYELEGALRDQILIDGKRYTLFLYGKPLSPNPA